MTRFARTGPGKRTTPLNLIRHKGKPEPAPVHSNLAPVQSLYPEVQPEELRFEAPVGSQPALWGRIFLLRSTLATFRRMGLAQASSTFSAK